MQLAAGCNSQGAIALTQSFIFNLTWYCVTTCNTHDEHISIIIANIIHLIFCPGDVQEMVLPRAVVVLIE